MPDPLAHLFDLPDVTLLACVRFGHSVGVHGLHETTDQRRRIVCIADIEARVQLRHLRLCPELPRAEAVKGAKPERSLSLA
ncbi:hypothetical protein A0123_03407 [Gluconobacter cerinus]|uniref:Uncharacterized protein n=1 Tax=Gluconobacter cerinus TaxID=38307 RepID=A0A1B6VFY8_9PROT|nr:hypothetical protein A0123_03407 [Gluconobacter cerinus]